VTGKQGESPARAKRLVVGVGKNCKDVFIHTAALQSVSNLRRGCEEGMSRRFHQETLTVFQTLPALRTGASVGMVVSTEMPALCRISSRFPLGSTRETRPKE
jgi:hypothetical protein